MATKTVLSICPGNGCHAGCIHQTHVEDGKITKSERLTYPDGDTGDICVKGVAGARLPYHPDRLKYPLKRAGKRGEGKWERITWEQALDEIAEKMQSIRKQYGPESILFEPYGNSVPVSETQMLLGDRLKNLLEATDFAQGCGIDSGSMFSSYFSYGTSFACWLDPRLMVEGKTKYIIIWGTNPAEMGIRAWRFVREAQKNGAKVVDIGVIEDPTAKGSDWWIQVQPGSDNALALAMIDVIIKENLYDEEYVAKHTNGPFLVRTDNGKMLRESDISPEGSASNYVVWDSISGKPETIVPYVGGREGIKPALKGTFTASGIECKPAFQLLAELASEYTCQKASAISKVPVETIQKLAREYATTKPAMILVRHGLRYTNAGNAHRSMEALAAITGNTGKMGGGILNGTCTQGSANAPLLKLNDDPIKHPTPARSKIVSMAQYMECIRTGKPYPIKAFIMYASNLFHSFPSWRRWREDILPNLDLLVVNDIFMTATAEYADYVLPDCTLFERDDMDIGLNGYILWLEKAIEPMYECKPPIYFWSELAKRLGFGEYFDKTLDEWTALRLDSRDPSITGIDPPITVERLKKEKMIRANVPEGIFYPWGPMQFPTPSGRIEFYHEQLLSAGDALPVFKESLESPRSALAKKYPMVFMTANNRYFMHTQFANDPKILEQYIKEPHLSINPEDARKRSISNDDVVTVYNDRGKLKAKALITGEVPPGVVNIPHGWWPRQYIEGHYRDLIASIATMKIRDKSREIYWDLAYEQWQKGTGGQYPETILAFSPDSLFDCLCEVKKA